jgi:type IV pilus assembly protein PilM
MMFYIGITLEKDVFRVAILKKEKQSVTVESVHTFPYGPDNVKLFYNLAPFHTGEEICIASGLLSSEIFIRKLYLPLKDRRKILAALPFQLESLIPFPSDALIICALFKSLSKQMTTVTVIAAAKENLTSHLEALKNLDIAVDVVSCAPNALMRFGRWTHPEENKVLSIDIRDQKLCCVVFEGNEILLSQTMAFSSKDQMALDLEKLSAFLAQKGAIDEKTPWILTGEIDFAEQISSVFRGERLQIREDLKYAVCIGFALDALAQDRYCVQFCQKAFTPSHTLEKRKKKGFAYLAFCLGAALLMVTGSTWMQNKKLSHLADKLQGCLPPSLSQGSFTTPDEIEKKLMGWESSLRGPKNAFAFVPDVPFVSDVLAWLSSHPALATEDGGQKEGLEIKSVHYTLTKYPKIGETSLPYFAQTELEFFSKTPRAARDFHEALLKGDKIVNAKKEVKWQTQNQTYNAAFELNKGVVK